MSERKKACAALAVLMLASGSAVAADAAPQAEKADALVAFTGSFEQNAGWLNPTASGIGNSILIGPKIESGFTVKPVDGLSLIGNLVAEPVVDAQAGKNQIFSGLGAYVDLLQVQYDMGDLSIWGGKIHPAFGRAWDVAPGLHAGDLAENYELAERLGAAGGVHFDAGGFANLLQASVFTKDRSVLSESLANNRGRTSLADGGAGNTSGLSSVAVALDGCMGAQAGSCYDEGSLGYQIAARYQKGGVGSPKDETGLVGSVNKTIALQDDQSIRLLGEAAWFNNYDGATANALALTASAAFETGPMNYSASYSRQHSYAGASANTDLLVDVSAMYDLGSFDSLPGDGWSVGAGYSYSRKDGEGANLVGLRLQSDFGG